MEFWSLQILEIGQRRERLRTTSFSALGYSPSPTPRPPTSVPATISVFWTTAEVISLVDCVGSRVDDSIQYLSSRSVYRSAVAIRGADQRFGTVAILGVTLTVLGFAAGPLVMAPASEVIGRRNVYLVCGILFSAFSWGAAEADDAAAMLVCRFFLGFFGAASINNVPASIGDFTFPHNRNRYSVSTFTQLEMLD